MHEEGWYTDPYGLHDARWMSDGEPTGLVRDGGSEWTEPVPHGPLTSIPQRLGAEDGDGSTTADVVQANSTTNEQPSYRDAAEEGFGGAL